MKLELPLNFFYFSAVSRSHLNASTSTNRFTSDPVHFKVEGNSIELVANHYVILGYKSIVKSPNRATTIYDSNFPFCLVKRELNLVSGPLCLCCNHPTLQMDRCRISGLGNQGFNCEK